ncbi:allantoinase [Naasia aerilata]|uniref:allantoinase n=1 Tax=Naasia aerilata TaxID=1162966 RepID=A0ABN6XL26_9MICO|nr:allantoinase [Naasia aerilata]
MADELDRVIRGDRVLVDGVLRPAEVGIRDGRVVAIESLGAGLAAPELDRLAEDEVLLPGLVDTHVHINEPGRTEWEGFATATRAAAAGGVTTLLDMPLNSIPPTIDVPSLEAKRQAAAAGAVVDVGFWGGAVPSSLGHLRELHEAGVFGFKAFLAPSGVDEFPELSRAQLREALEEIASFGGLLIVHAEDPGVLDQSVNEGGRSYPRFVDSRPQEAETSAIEAVIDGVRATGARAHILHLSAASALPLLAAAKGEGLPITAETCPHYLTIDAEHIPDGATQYKCCPPIRDARNQDALWAGLLDGTIDLIVSDHSPSTPERKFAGDGDFAIAWGGIAGLQLGLSAVWSEARRRGIGLERVAGWMAERTAGFAGLVDKGRIAVGAAADLAVFAPDEPLLVRAAELLHRNPVSAYDGRTLTGRVRRTYLGGTILDPRSGHPPAGCWSARGDGTRLPDPDRAAAPASAAARRSGGPRRVPVDPGRVPLRALLPAEPDRHRPEPRRPVGHDGAARGAEVQPDARGRAGRAGHRRRHPHAPR